jgi:glycosyltransferase involved in cell wall biosynthesis
VRILYVADRLGGRGGADRHLLQVIRSAAAAGARVTVAAGRIDPELELPPLAEAIRVRGLETPIASSSRLAALTTLLGDAQLVHVQNVMNPVAIAEATATGRAVVTVQDHRVFCPGMGKTLPDGAACRRPMSHETCSECLPDRDYRTRTLALTRARSDALGAARLVVLSRFMAAELSHVGLPGADVLPPWLDVAPDRPEPGDGFLVGGRLVTHKGVLDAVCAWRRAGTGLPLRVAGDGPLANDLAGTERLGWLPPGRLRDELRRARAVLFPSVWQEPLGMLALEALAEGTPVIVADVGGTSDWSDAGCVRVPPRDVEAMAEALKRLADDPEGAVELGRQGRTMVADRYARVTIEPRLHSLYAEVAAG